MNVNTLIQSLQANSVDLGISWDLIPGTITKDGDGLVNVQVDADQSNTIIQAISLVGSLAVNTRVMLLAVPPSTLFVIGRLGATSGYLTGDIVHYTADGTFSALTYPGLRAAFLEGMAGGGGGGFASAAVAGNSSAGGGGGGGGYAAALVTETQLGADTWTVTIGALGAGGTSAAIDGAAGGTMSIVSGATTLLAATGGNGGESISANNTLAISNGGAGGVGTTGDVLIRGSQGGNGIRITGGNGGYAGNGGAGAVWGALYHPSSADGGGVGNSADANSGSGGAGGADQSGSNTNRNGGAGGTGRVRITVLY